MEGISSNCRLIELSEALMRGSCTGGGFVCYGTWLDVASFLGWPSQAFKASDMHGGVGIFQFWCLRRAFKVSDKLNPYSSPFFRFPLTKLVVSTG